MKKESGRFRDKSTELEKKCKLLEKRLQQSEDRFRKIFHASSNMMALTTIKDGRIIDLNEASASLGGFKRKDLIGALSSERSLWADLKQRDKVIQRIQEEGKVHNMEVDFIAKDGEIHRALFSADPVILNDEPCLLSVSVDITARQRQSDALRESREYLNQIINCISDPIFVKDSKHRFVHVNDAFCALMGMQPDQLLGKTGFETMPEERARYLMQQEEEVIRSGIEIQVEDSFRDEQGASHIVMAKKSMLADKNGNRQVVVVARDITEYKQLEAQFLQAQKMEAIGVLAGGVAHDFNNLLNVINGYSELVLEDLAEDNPIRIDLEQVREAGRRAADLTSQLLAFGRKQILQPEILDLNGIIQRMSSMLCRLIGEDVEFMISTKPDLGFIHADPGQIQQIIMNLAVNARDAMPHGGKLIIETANVNLQQAYVQRHPMVKPGPYVMLAISDSGIGMDEATQSHLFEPFFTTKRKGKGTGLGLSTVYGIVRQSGGFIWVYSEPGKGTTFKIYFPQAAAGIASEMEADTGKSEIGGSETVLVVEDELSVRKLAGRILRDRGYNVLEASDGMDALRIAENHIGEIHLILTDVVMPGMSGSALVSKLEEARPGIKALYISGYTDNAIVHHGILNSNVAFLQKPFTIDGLIRKLREVLNS